MRWRPRVLGSSQRAEPAPEPASSDDRLRILFCTLGYPPGPGGGAENQARLQAEELVKRGHSVTVVCPSSPHVESGQINGVQVVRLPWPHNRWYLREVTYLPMLAGYIGLNARNFDLVHVHLASRQADVAVLAAKPAGRPVYVKVAGGGRGREITPTAPVRLVTRHAGLKGADTVQALSAQIAQDLRAIGVAEDKIVRIPNGLAAGRWSDASAEHRAEARVALDLPADSVVVLFAGRFAQQKGLRDLLNAWAATPQLQQAKLVLVGEPALDDPMGAIEESDSVIVRGWTDNLQQFYWAADIFVLPSYAEGMSNTLLEAMCNGLPVVATKVGAAPEMIESGKEGFLIDPGDPASLAAALTRLVADADLRARVGAAAAEMVRSRFGIEEVVTQIERRYRQILAQSIAKKPNSIR